MTLWITTAEADTYFSTRLDSDAWDDAGAKKTAALTTAQADIVNSGNYAFLDDDGEEIPDDEATEEMQFSICEQALFLLGPAYSEERIALIAQAVDVANVVGEEYAGLPGGTGVVLAPKAKAFLRGFATGSSEFDVTK